MEIKNSEENLNNKEFKKAKGYDLLYQLYKKEKELNSFSENVGNYLEQIIIYSLSQLEKKKVKQEDLPFNFTNIFSEGIQFFNSQGMAKNNENEDNLFLILKAVDLLMLKQIQKYIFPIQKLGELKVTTFNNLACIYQEKSKFQHALNALNYAIEIEEKLTQDFYQNSNINIISTYMNKGAILSSLGQHKKGLDGLLKALEKIKFIEKYQGNEQILKGLRLILYYNVGAQNEHLHHNDKALFYYKEALKIAQVLNDQQFIKKLQEALKIV